MEAKEKSSEENPKKKSTPSPGCQRNTCALFFLAISHLASAFLFLFSHAFIVFLFKVEGPILLDSCAQIGIWGTISRLAVGVEVEKPGVGARARAKGQ